MTGQRRPKRHHALQKQDIRRAVAPQFQRSNAVCHALAVYENGNVTGKDGINVGTGLSGQWQIAKPLALRLDINYSYSNFRTIEGGTRMHALNVPLTLMLTPGGKKMIEPFAGIGAFMDYFFAGTLVADDGAKQKVSFGSNYNSTAIFSSTLRFFRIFACPF